MWRETNICTHNNFYFYVKFVSFSGVTKLSNPNNTSAERLTAAAGKVNTTTEASSKRQSANDLPSTNQTIAKIKSEKSVIIKTEDINHNNNNNSSKSSVNSKVASVTTSMLLLQPNVGLI